LNRPLVNSFVEDCLDYAQNPLHTFSHYFPVTGKLPTCHRLVVYVADLLRTCCAKVANLLRTCYGETGVMNFGLNAQPCSQTM